MSSVRGATCALNAAGQATTNARTSTSTRRMAADYTAESAVTHRRRADSASEVRLKPDTTNECLARARVIAKEGCDPLRGVARIDVPAAVNPCHHRGRRPGSIERAAVAATRRLVRDAVHPDGNRHRGLLIGKSHLGVALARHMKQRPRLLRLHR